MLNKLNSTLLFIFLLSLQLPAQQATLLYDLKPGTADGIESEAVAVAGGQYFFHGKTDAEGQELWVTDGTAAGTHLVKDIDPGAPSGTGGGLIVFKDKVWFVGDKSNTGTELWSSDGTEAGTTVIDVATGSDDSNPGHLAAGTDYLYFTAWDNTFTRGLYRTDGTAAGTSLVTTQLGDATALEILEVAVLGNTAYIALDGPKAGQIWKSDGTAAGTVLLKDLHPGSFGLVKNLTPIGNKIYFAGSTSFGGYYQPWVTDGTSAGTLELKEILPNANADPRWFTEFKGKVYFHAFATNSLKGFWRTDGTPAGTELFKDIAISEFSNDRYNLASDANYLYFSGSTASEGRELWKTDGTLAGTAMVKDLDPGFWSSHPSQFSMANGKLYFKANVGGNGEELCVSNSTTAGTMQITDFFPGSSTNSSPRNIRALGNKLVFVAKHPSYGVELFQLDITSGTGSPQANIAIAVSPNPGSDMVKVSLPESMVETGGQLRLFNAAGAMVWEGISLGSETMVSVESWPSGLYWMEYRSGKIWGREKLVVLH